MVLGCAVFADRGRIAKRVEQWLVAAAALALMLWTVRDGARADAPPGRYTVPGDGTVKDNQTGLVWKRNEEPGLHDWAGAKAQCVSPWRLPRIQELATIVDITKISSPYIDATAFQGAASGSAPTSGFLWSSSPAALSSGRAWYVGFDAGQVGDLATSSSGGVRCVR